MNFRYIILLILISFFTVSYGQEKKFPKITYSTETELAKKMQELTNELLKNHFWEDKTDSIFKVIKLCALNEKYDQLISSVNSLDAYYKKNYPQYEEYMGKSLLVYAKAKLRLQKENISFEQSYSEELNNFIESIKKEKPGYLDYFFSYTILDEPENLKELLKKQKDSSSLDETYVLLRTYGNTKLYNETNKLISKVLKEYEEKNYIINDSVIITNGNVKTPVRVIRSRKLQGKQPTILNFSIYAEESDIILGKFTAIEGYTSVIAYTRGKWLSENELHPFENDGEDAYNVIDWISKQPCL